MRAEDYVYVVPNLSWGASGGSTGAHCFLNQGCTQVLSGNSAGRLGSDSLCFWFRNPVLMSHGSHVIWVVTHSLKNCGLGDLAKCLPGLHFVCENKMFTGWKFLLRQASQNRWDVRHLPKWPQTTSTCTAMSCACTTTHTLVSWPWRLSQWRLERTV